MMSNINQFEALRFNRRPSLHDWERHKVKVYDDGTLSFFWQAHTLTVLFLFIGCLVFVAFFEEHSTDPEYNIKRGIIACILVFLFLGVTIIPDGPFRRPHPVIWRLVFCVSIVYELILIFLFFQDKLDVFVPTHFFGWWIKTLMLRDWWICTVMSIMFEILEYTLEHQLPNFSECWWDHWLMDALICNGLGIYLGMLTLKYLSMKPYHWRGLWSIPTCTGKLKRMAAQFGPYSWIPFDWRPTLSFTRWICISCLIFLSLLLELNTFYLKFVLWLEPPHFLNVFRLVLMALAGAVSTREYFQFLDDPNCKTIGRQLYITVAIIITEFLVIAKFDTETITKPLPSHIVNLWLLAFSGLFLWTIWKFFLDDILLLNGTTKIHLNEKSSDNHVEEQNNLKNDSFEKCRDIYRSLPNNSDLKEKRNPLDSEVYDNISINNISKVFLRKAFHHKAIQTDF